MDRPTCCPTATHWHSAGVLRWDGRWTLTSNYTWIAFPIAYCPWCGKILPWANADEKEGARHG